jgi:uncharacterized protein YraI
MGYFRFRRSLKLLPGVRWNIGANSTSISFGSRGFRYTLGTKGSRTTVGIPGTGISYTHAHTSKPRSIVRPPLSTPPSAQTSSKGKPSRIFYMLGLVALSIWIFGSASERKLPQSAIAKTSQANAAAPVNPDHSQMEVRRALAVEPTANAAELAGSTQMPSTTPFVRTCRVVNIAARDSLKLRAGPGSTYPVITKIPAGTRGIMPGHKRVRKGTTTWQEVSWDSHTGWVNEIYIATESERETRKANPLQNQSTPRNTEDATITER